MKKAQLFLSILLITSGVFAQSPDLMSYQAVIRNASGILLAKQEVNMRVSIYYKEPLMNSVYSETHKTTTNNNGLVTLQIGAGTVISGNIGTIDWDTGPYFLQTETDPDGGENYTLNNISQMLSVPYALYAKSSGNDRTNWRFSGNNAAASDFIGTTNDQPLIFKVNNERVGYLGNGTSIFFGYGAGATSTGFYNVAVGQDALHSNINGVYNTAIGYASLYKNVSGSGNTALGGNSLSNSTTGYANVAIGRLSLITNTTGHSNTAIGDQTLYSNITGSNNIAIGYLADVGAINLTNATVIGNDVAVNASNKVRIGNTSVTVIEGQVAWSRPSDARFKFNIQNNVPGLGFIKRLQPVTYHFDHEKLNEYTKTGLINNEIMHHAAYSGEKEIHTGFLAQDVEEIANELGYHFDGVHVPVNDKDHYSLAYAQFIMPLVKAVQEQQEMIDQQKSVTAFQQKTIEKLQDAIEKLEKKIEVLSNK